MAVQISLGDTRYEESVYQEFRTFEEAERLLGGYCNQCRSESNCKINHELRCAMGDNYPFFSREFVKLELRGFSDIPNLEEIGERLPETTIVCKQFKSKQLTFAFAED